MLRYWKALTNRQIAAELKTSESTVKRLLFEAKILGIVSFGTILTSLSPRAFLISKKNEQFWWQKNPRQGRPSVSRQVFSQFQKC